MIDLSEAFEPLPADKPAQPEAVLAAGDIVQIDPAHDLRFGGCLLVISEVRSWGVIGYVSVPDSPKPAQAWNRLPWGSFERIGVASWVLADADDPDVVAHT